MNSFPSTKTPVFCDMSSDIFSRLLDFSKFDLIYAGALIATITCANFVNLKNLIIIQRFVYLQSK